jgi:predicted outer membrane repeat protein
MKKKFLALVMTLSMVLSLVPMTALAAEGDKVDTVAAESQSAGEDANGGSQDSNFNADSGNTPTGGGDITDTSDTNTNTNNKDEGKDSGSENTDGTTGPSKPDAGTTEGGSTEGGETGSGSGSETPSTPETSTDVAKIGETKYATIEAAIDKATDTDTIVLLRNVTENITINKSLTLDLAGFTLTGADEENAVVTIAGSDETKPTVTIKSSKVDGEKPVNGTITGGRNPQNGGGFAIDSAVVRLEDLTITGNETVGGDSNGEVGGGGIFALHADVSMQNVTVSENSVTESRSDGGGILVRYGSLTMDGCHVEGNTAPDCGGGMILRHSELNAANSFFENNTAKQGAGIYFNDASGDAEEGCSGKHEHLITDSTISGNIASNIGGGMYVGTISNLTLRNSKLLKNDGATQGGAIVAYSVGTIELDRVSVSENTAQSGAGIYALCTAVCNTDIHLLNGTAIDANTATVYGGGIYAYAMANTLSVTAENSSVSGNTAADGAGIFAIVANSEKANLNVNLQSGATVNDNTATGNFGGGIYAYAMGNNLNVSVADSSISGNTANNGAGIFTYALPDPTTQEITAEINVNLNSGATMHKNTATTGSGGAIYAYDKSAHINVAEGSALYNNTAKNAGDDLWMHDATFTLPNASEMSGDKQFKISDEENGTVTGWFYDGWFKWDPNAPSASGEAETKGAYVEAARWSMDKADEYSPKDNDTQAIALKAATKKAPSPGGGGGGGSHKPTVTIPDDVPTGLNGKDHYAYVVGYPDGMVYPQKNITRAEVATIFFRLLEDETREANMTKSNSYNDMKDGAWYTCAVSTLSKMGIIKGYEDGSFKPDASISRAEFAAIAARFDPDGDTTPATFSDVSSHWAKDEISIAANHGWIKGYEDGSFKPDQKITRAETMTLVNRVLKRLPETKDDLHKDMKTWPDNQNESAWFYLAVQEATNSHYQNLKKDGTHEKWESMRETRDWAALEK